MAPGPEFGGSNCGTDSSILPYSTTSVLPARISHWVLGPACGYDGREVRRYGNEGMGSVKGGRVVSKGGRGERTLKAVLVRGHGTYE